VGIQDDPTGKKKNYWVNPVDKRGGSKDRLPTSLSLTGVQSKEGAYRLLPNETGGGLGYDEKHDVLGGALASGHHKDLKV